MGIKIITQKLSPLFHQYDIKENRLTHALLHTISCSERILSLFLKEVLGLKLKKSGLGFEVSTQKKPFLHEDTESNKSDSVPDGWIVTLDKKLGIAIEVKVIKNKVRPGQLKNHIGRLKAYDVSYLLVITPDSKEPVKISTLRQAEDGGTHILWKSWHEIYRLFRIWRDVNFKGLLKEQFILNSILEYINIEDWRKVMGFQGIPFNKDVFDVEQAKKILKDEMDELQDTVHNLFPKLTSTHSAVATAFSKSSVWNCFGISEDFTKDIHITFSLSEHYHDISLTIPDKAPQRWKLLKSVLSESDREQKFMNLIKKLRCKVPNLFFKYLQRHFINRRKSVDDASLEFNIDTLGSSFRNLGSPTKEFPVWFDFFKEAIRNKKKINAQAQFKVRFYYDDTPTIEKETFLETAKKTLEAIHPLYVFLNQEK